MHLDILLEERSAKLTLEILIPKIIGSHISLNFIEFQGKQDLLKNLPNRLRGYSHWLPPDYRIVVLIDEDRQNCHQLKQQLETAAHQAGLITKTSASPGQTIQVLNRIAIEELEAWFWGDFTALQQAYPKLPASLPERKNYRTPDAIPGGTVEALERELQRAGYHKGGLAKTQAARDIAPYLDPLRNGSQSFQIFYQGLRSLMEQT